jgi:hypothetical protein
LSQIKLLKVIIEITSPPHSRGGAGEGCKSITAFIIYLYLPPHSRVGVVCKSITAFIIYLYPPPHSRGGAGCKSITAFIIYLYPLPIKGEGLRVGCKSRIIMNSK